MHFFLFSYLSFFYPPPPLITSYPYLLSSLTLKLTRPQTVSNTCFTSACVSPQTLWHSTGPPDAALVLQTCISRAAWDQALTPTVITEISWPLLRSVLLVTVPEAAWYRWAQQQHSHAKQLCVKICIKPASQIPCKEQHIQALCTGLGLVNPAKLGKAVSSQTRSLNLVLGSQAAYWREFRHTQHPELQKTLSASHLTYECIRLA